MVIRIGNEIFSATLFDNPTAEAFGELLPLAIVMHELNENEKYAELEKNLPVNSKIPEMIHTGDIMIYGSSTLVLFYQTFKTSYPYTQMGKVDNPSKLATVLGTKDVSVKFELK